MMGDAICFLSSTRSASFLPNMASDVCYFFLSLAGWAKSCRRMAGTLRVNHQTELLQLSSRVFKCPVRAYHHADELK